MDVAEFFTMSSVCIVAGKGGVGKTTVAAAWSLAAADAGLRVLLVGIEGDQQLAHPLGIERLTYEPTPVPVDGRGSLSVCVLGARDALVDYLGAHGLKRLSRRLASTGALDVVATAAPGIDDILVLGKVKQLANAGIADLIVVDAPASGHAVSFLGSAHGLLDAVRVGPIQTQARDVIEMLTDPTRAQVVLVTLAEETPVNEAIETAFAMEDRIGVALGPVVVNAVYPVIDGLDAELDRGAGPARLVAAGRFRRAWTEQQREQIERLAVALPLTQIRLPFVFDARIGRLAAEGLAAHVLTAADGIAG
jgi:Mrp family chromosome partitioning ATPase